MVLPVYIAVGLATLVVMVVMVKSLATSAGRLAGAMKEFRDEVQPIVTQIQDETRQASEKAQRQAERAEQLRTARSGRKRPRR